MSAASLSSVARPVRRRLQRLVQKAASDGSGRRANAILLLLEGVRPSSVAITLCAARSTVYRWLGWFLADGEQGLCRQRGGRPRWTIDGKLVALVKRLVEKSPHEFNYLRTNWSSETLAMQVKLELGVAIHPSTIRRLLPTIGYNWRRPRPILNRRDPRKQDKLKAIDQAVKQRDPRVPVVFADEVDIHLLPKMGYVWSKRGKQRTILTPGQNRKNYIAGALSAHNGKITYVEGNSKSSQLFIDLLVALRRRYRGATRIVVVLDNYIIHKSKATRRWLEKNPKFHLVFQPVYCPGANRIERLWKTLHDTVTRNHHWTSMTALMQAVRHFMVVAEPWPGNRHGMAQLP